MDRGRDIHPDDNKLIKKQVTNNCLLANPVDKGPDPTQHIVISHQNDR